MAPKAARLRAQLVVDEPEPWHWTFAQWVGRVLVLGAAIMDRVGRHWLALARRHQPGTAAPPRPRRRDDLTGVGAPVAPTAAAYPAKRTLCTHISPEGHTLLRATGGRRRGREGTAVAMYLWTCRACGSRWERVPAPPGQAPNKNDVATRSSSAALTPTILVGGAPDRRHSAPDISDVIVMVDSDDEVAPCQ